MCAERLAPRHARALAAPPLPALRQAGRAGRDGLPARCVLLWGSGDAATLRRLKEPEAASAEARELLNAQLARMQVPLRMQPAATAPLAAS